MCLRDALWDASLETSALRPSSKRECENKVLVAQATSIGSLGPDSDRWLSAEFVKSMRGGECAWKEAEKLVVLYPTQRQVCVHASMARLVVQQPCWTHCLESVVCSGGTLSPMLSYRGETHAKQRWIEGFLGLWQCARVLGLPRETRSPLPHLKTYAQVDAVSGRPDWMLVTSANLSKAAWGQLQKRETQLCVRSYEVGVLFICRDETCVLPFDYPFVAYSSSDVPFTI